MAKIVYNACFGGFSPSPAAVMRYAEIKGLVLFKYVHADGGWDGPLVRASDKDENWRVEYHTEDPPDGDRTFFSAYDLGNDRTDPVLVQVIEELGEAASEDVSDLRIRELAAGTLYRIDEYDGCETVVTRDEENWGTA